jgi:glycosyltransferase involved in cell wall biosynthesis
MRKCDERIFPEKSSAALRIGHSLNIRDLCFGNFLEASRSRLRLKKVSKLNAPLVSVIIPAFNAAEYIRQTVNSVLAQTYQALEVIVVDDGSSDTTSAIVEEFQARDARIQLVQQSNAGVGAARNAGICRARGKYIAPLDADDLWVPEKLEKQVARMEQCGNGTGLVYCWSKLTGRHADRVELNHPFRLEGRLRHAMVLRNIIGNASVPLFRAAALEKVGLYLTRAEQGGAQGCEDWDLTLRIAEMFRIRVVPEYLVVYLQNSSSMSGNAESMTASFVVTMHRARQRNGDLPSAAFRWSGGYFYLYLTEKCYVWADYPRCLRYLKEAVCANPVLLLRLGIYGTLWKSIIRIIARSVGIQLAKPVRGLSGKMGKGVDLDSEQRRKRKFILNMLFRHFELARWSAALDDGG